MSGKGLRQEGATGCDNGEGTQSNHENWGSLALLTLGAVKTQGNAAKAGMSRGLKAPVLWLRPRCLPGPADPGDVQQQPLLRALQGEGSSRGGDASTVLEIEG